MKKLMLPFMALAAIGFVLSLIVHVLSLLNISPPFGSSVFALHIGGFIVWLPTIIVSEKFKKGVNRNDFWKAALRDCPQWMRYVVRGASCYAVINISIFALLRYPFPKHQSASEITPLDLRMFSAGWMAFYSTAFATLYSWLHSSDTEVKQ